MWSHMPRSSRRQLTSAPCKSIQKRSLRLENERAREVLRQYDIAMPNRPRDTERGDTCMWNISIVADRKSCKPLLHLSQNKGSTTPDAEANRRGQHGAFSFPIHYSQGITDEIVAGMVQHTACDAGTQAKLSELTKSLWRLFTEKDAVLAELSQVGIPGNDAKQAVEPLQARLIFDEAAAKRQKDLFALRDPNAGEWRQTEAEKFGLVYKRMEGTIGTVVNGAGLAMATNDAIEQYGGTSANFLDAGGQATKGTMIEAFRLVLSDERVKAVLVNIYGGITKCDMIAQSVIGAAQELTIHVPVVVRLQGTNSQEGLKLLEEADLGLHVEAGFGEAAQKAVRLSTL